MVLFALVYLGGVLTIVSPCILPVLPFVFARADRPFVRSGLPLLVGMAATFAAVATLAAVGGGWAEIGQQVDPRPIDDRVVMRTGERERTIGKLGGEGPGHVAELGQVGRVEMDHEPVRDERSIGGRQAFTLHRSFDPTLQLDGLDARAKETSRRALKQAFEEPLDGGELRHGRSRSLPEGPAKA